LGRLDMPRPVLWLSCFVGHAGVPYAQGTGPHCGQRASVFEPCHGLRGRHDQCLAGVVAQSGERKSRRRFQKPAPLPCDEVLSKMAERNGRSVRAKLQPLVGSRVCLKPEVTWRPPPMPPRSASTGAASPSGSTEVMSLTFWFGDVRDCKRVLLPSSGRLAKFPGFASSPFGKRSACDS